TKLNIWEFATSPQELYASHHPLRAPAQPETRPAERPSKIESNRRQIRLLARKGPSCRKDKVDGRKD
ncbi:hypothetical protein AGABI2DRAFT_136395, partial [Agaricus bisporus var. bisporus H97]|uniref:hypothetical protein n=1 Tax=Agaricus bisporus var. bisporus (strain H97 / ATCC MYA-4626 / FGSC 10389) TaxID=936046 RepID=UPI00029F56E5